jgi:glycosyltransferase involved in cell wall biosynthesis
MVVALDATPLTEPTGGIRRYTCELSRALAEQFPYDDFVLISDQPYDPPPLDLRNLHRGPGPRYVLDLRWWSWGLNRALDRMGAAVFHGTDFAVPYIPRCPSVLTLHDLSPWMDASWHFSAARVRRRTPALIQLGIATIIITVTEAVRRQAIERFRIHPERIHAVPLAAGAHFRPASNPISGPDYFLYVGTLEPRKNLETLVSAWREIRRDFRVDLVIAGRAREDFAPPPAQDGLKLIGAVSEHDLPALYSGALAFVYPSLYEGFGLPVLEAMRCGAAVITSNDPAIAEVAGSAAVQVNAGDVRALVREMRGVLTNSEWREELRCRSLERSARFSWSNTAARTREIYDEALRRDAR